MAGFAARARDRVVALRRNWLPLFTGAIFAVAALTVVLSKDLDSAAKVGDIVAGFSAALAFLWLVAGFRLQTREIGLQRIELKLQREAMELQAKELRNSARLSSLAQIEAILNRTSGKIAESGTGVSLPTEINSKWSQGMALWKDMLESGDKQVVQSNYLEWMKVETLARGYVAGVASALRIYLEHHTEVFAEFDKSDEEFVFVYGSWMSKAPFLAEHYGASSLVSNLLVSFEPGLKAIRLAGLVAASKEFGSKMFKPGSLNQMRAELIETKTRIPRIAETGASLD